MDAEHADALRKSFPPTAIGKLPKGGTFVDYVGHAAVTDRLLAVDPHWSWEPFAVDERGLPALDNKNNLWIRLTVCGVTRIGVGDGPTAKVIVGDAIRNAAMRFGVALDLWSKEELESVHDDDAAGAQKATRRPQDEPPAPTGGTRRMARTRPAQTDGGAHPDDATPPSPEPLTAAQRAALHASFNGLGITDRDQRLAYCRNLIGRPIESSNDLTIAEASQILDALKQDSEEPRT